ncbi:MAG: GNAT family N-acetyltransferase [Mycobacterium leprae]
MGSVPILQGKRVLLRPPCEKDKQDRLALGRNAEFVRMCGGDHRNLQPFTPEQAERWYARLVAEPLEWVIEVNGRCIGTARLHHMDEENRRIRYAIGIFDPLAWGQGFGTEATRLVLRHAFDGLNLHRVDLKVLDYNHRAIACYEQCGFQREGIDREGAWIAGQWQSDLLMSILEQEYRAIAPTWG